MEEGGNTEQVKQEAYNIVWKSVYTALLYANGSSYKELYL